MRRQWALEQCKQGNYVWWILGEGVRLVGSTGSALAGTPEAAQVEAEARLMRAAPELAAALQTILDAGRLDLARHQQAVDALALAGL